MREAAFINKNKERWESLEKMLRGSGQISSDQLSGLYVQLTDDLSYARTFYKDSKVTAYLNNLSQVLHQKIYQNKKVEANAIWKFWVYDIPLLVREHHRQLLYSFIIFAVSFTIGAVSAANDSTFVRLILGDQYVDMTIDNIKNGKPMNVYADEDASLMFFYISWNNIKVSFNTFILGIMCSLGTFLILMYNGIMLGAFQYFFFEYDLLLTSVLSVWIHGTLEITAIIIAGGAGLVMGNSILYPGTYPRGYAFRKGAMNGVKIVCGLVPVFIVAAFFEGFVTRLSPEMHPAFSATIILSSLAFVIIYFVIYPIRLEGKLMASMEAANAGSKIHVSSLDSGELLESFREALKNPEHEHK